MVRFWEKFNIRRKMKKVILLTALATAGCGKAESEKIEKMEKTHAEKTIILSEEANLKKLQELNTKINLEIKKAQKAFETDHYVEAEKYCLSSKQMITQLQALNKDPKVAKLFNKLEESINLLINWIDVLKPLKRRATIEEKRAVQEAGKETQIIPYRGFKFRVPAKRDYSLAKGEINLEVSQLQLVIEREPKTVAEGTKLISGKIIGGPNKKVQDILAQLADADGVINLRDVRLATYKLFGKSKKK